MTRRRHLVFDLDGTLVDSAPDLATALNGLLAEMGKPALAESTCIPSFCTIQRLYA